MNGMFDGAEKPIKIFLMDVVSYLCSMNVICYKFQSRYWCYVSILIGMFINAINFNQVFLDEKLLI